MGHTAGLCECGCGQRTPVAQRNRYDRGQLKGQPLRFVPGHNTNRAPLEERFWRYVHKTDGYCWLWTGARDQNGYGRLQRGKQGEGIVKAHRLSYEIHHGQFDDALMVCHRCDNPQCVNPDHLFLGTNQDNVSDAVEKGRFPGRPFAADPAEVLDYYDACRSQPATARRFGISEATVRRYRKRR